MSSENLNRMMPRGRAGVVLALTLTAPVCLAILAPQKAAAIPAFARKYETSCTTCHVAIPALTPFGEAFRENGYRFPEGQDASMTKNPPVSLGAEGYKKLWPHAVWPGQIPAMPPLAVLYTSTIDYDHPNRLVTFAGMGGELEILGAGTLDEHFSFWGSVVFAREGDEIATEMERVNLLIRPLASPVLQFKVGSFEPGLMLVSTHRSIMDQELWALTEPTEDNPWAPEAFQQGIEAYGTIQHRVLYNAGVVEGSGSLEDKTKDVYGRVAYKWGGLAFDGVTTSATAGSANPKPWSELSIAVSAFAYHGRSRLAPDNMGFEPTDTFNDFGADVALALLDVTAHAGYTDRKDDRLFLDDPTFTDARVKNGFAEVYWVAYPWLIPAGRFESLKFTKDEGPMQKVSFTLNGLVRANVKTYLAADTLKESGGKFITEGGSLGVLIGF